MDLGYLFMFLGLITGSLGFIGDIIDYMEDLPLRFTSGSCYFLIGKNYEEAEFEISISFSKPTVDLYSANFVSYDRDYYGLSYKVVNMHALKPGLSAVKFTAGYFGSHFHGPRAWCRRLTDVVTTPVPTSTTSTAQPTTTKRITTTTLAKTTEASSTTSMIPSTTTTTTTDTPVTPTYPRDTTSSTVAITTSLQTRPPHPSPSK